MTNKTIFNLKPLAVTACIVLGDVLSTRLPTVLTIFAIVILYISSIGGECAFQTCWGCTALGASRVPWIGCPHMAIIDGELAKMLKRLSKPDNALETGTITLENLAARIRELRTRTRHLERT